MSQTNKARNLGSASNVFFFKQKTAYEMRISDWSSDVCSSDLGSLHAQGVVDAEVDAEADEEHGEGDRDDVQLPHRQRGEAGRPGEPGAERQDRKSVV